MATKRAVGRAPKRKESPAKPAAAPADLFSGAVATAESAKESTKKEKPLTVLELPPSAGEDMHTALRSVRSGRLQVKSAEAQLDTADELLKPLAHLLYAEEWLRVGKRVPGPVHIKNKNGDAVSYVLTDKTKSAKFDQETYDKLIKLAPGLAEHLKPHTVFALNPAVLAEEGVQEKLNAAIRGSGLSDEQQQKLLIPHIDYRAEESLLPHLTSMVEGSAKKLCEILSTMKGALQRYLGLTG